MEAWATVCYSQGGIQEQQATDNKIFGDRFAPD